MKFLGMKSTVWCLLDAGGQVEKEGSVDNASAALATLVKELAGGDAILAGQEVGTMSYLVHDTLSLE